MSQLTKAEGPITGVCGGLGKYFNLDPTIVRVLIFILTLFSGGIILLVYIILAVVMPKNELNDQNSSSGGIALSNNEDVIFCKSCGAQNEKKGKFCKKCGEPL